MSTGHENYGPALYADAKLKGCECERPWRNGDECGKCGRPLAPVQQHVTIRRDRLGREITKRAL